MELETLKRVVAKNECLREVMNEEALMCCETEKEVWDYIYDCVCGHAAQYGFGVDWIFESYDYAIEKVVEDFNRLTLTQSC